MNKLTHERRARVIQALIEGNSIRATCRLTGTAKGTVLTLLGQVGEACWRLHDQKARKLTTKRVQCDEIWSFVGCKQRNIELGKRGAGDVWTWVALDAETKLAISWRVGDRGPDTAGVFMRDVAARLANRVQLTTDGHSVYLTAVEEAFGWNGVDYSMLMKLYESERGAGQRYSPPACTGTVKTWVMGRPDDRHVSTSFVERSNLTMRMQMRRFTRLTNAFSKKVQNHTYAVHLHFLHYNFCRPHQTLTKKAKGIYRTPAMAAGLTDRVWTVADIVALLDQNSTNSN